MPTSWKFDSMKVTSMARHVASSDLGCTQEYIIHLIYRIAGNFRGRKLPQISHFYGYLRKFSLQNFGGMAPTGVAKVSNLWKFSPQKFSSWKITTVFTNSRSFPLYGMSQLANICILPLSSAQVLIMKQAPCCWIPPYKRQIDIHIMQLLYLNTKNMLMADECSGFSKEGWLCWYFIHK